ncbi:hypothetical protein [Methylobacterium mesophilicum]
MRDAVKDVVVKLGIEVDHEGFAKAREALTPLCDLVASLHALKALGINVTVTVDGAEPASDEA